MLLSRRSFLVGSATLPWAVRAAKSSSIPIGLELYSVRESLQKDPEGTVRAVAQMGYQVVEFYAPYFGWSDAQAKHMRKVMDDLGIRCYSTHNDDAYLASDKINRARDLNLILGSKYVVLAYAEPKPGLDGWKPVADLLNAAAEHLEPSGLKAGYHNHEADFTQVSGARPIEFLAKNTKTSVMLQLDVGTCLKAGSDPAAWIRAHPGRIGSVHLKDWSSDPSKDYKVLFGEGDANWKSIFSAAESVGGSEYYLLEQEGSRFSEMETARRCLDIYRALHA